eukprot:TRINITY_DN92225_c0_g1_i1.p1 TRINITY_DN92225_c0_g1~~TRINITY_DN92225_c0_g1_i1.p1  ORF type:complete len:593 (+),score=106.83 TRINITY_DN92225_c0_g1_i1:72-1781(+)
MKPPRSNTGLSVRFDDGDAPSSYAETDAGTFAVQDMFISENSSDIDSDQEEEDLTKVQGSSKGKSWTRTKSSLVSQHWLAIASRKIGKSMLFNLLSVAIIVANLFLAGLLVDARTKHAQITGATLQILVVTESIFIIFFIFELAVRIVSTARDCRTLLQDPLLILDIVAVVAMALDDWVIYPLGSAELFGDLAMFGVFRIFRGARCVMVLGRLRAFRKLYDAVRGVWECGPLLLVALAFLVSVTFSASVTMCLLLGPSSPQHELLPKHIATRFQSVARSFLTLSEAVLSGVEWGPELVAPLLDSTAAPFAGVLLLIFIVTASALLLNIIAGFFVQQVHATTQRYTRDVADRDTIKAAGEQLEGFVEVLQSMDESGNGELSLADYVVAITQNAEVMSNLGITLQTAKATFNRLDVDKTGIVHIMDFIVATKDVLTYKSIELLVVENQQQRLLTGLRRQHRRSKKRLGQLEKDLKLVEEKVYKVHQSTEVLPDTMSARLQSQMRRVIKSISEDKSGADSLREEALRMTRSDWTPRPDIKSDDFITRAWKQTLEKDCRVQLRHMLRKTAASL